MSPALRVLADAGIKLHEWQERIVRAYESGAPVELSWGWRRTKLPEGTPLGFAAERDNRATGQRRRRLSKRKNDKDLARRALDSE